MPHARCFRLGWTRALQGALLVVVLGGLGPALAARAEAAPRPQGPLASICVGSPLFPIDEVLFEGKIQVFDRLGSKLWDKAGGRTEALPFRPAAAGTYRTVYTAEGTTFTFRTRVLACPPGSTVNLDIDAAPLLSMTNARPGDSARACVVVTYSDPNPGRLRLFGATNGSELADHLDLVVTRGTLPAAAAGTCRGFRPDTRSYGVAGAGVLYRGTLQGFPDSYATARLDPAKAWAHGESHAYRFAVSLRDDNRAQGLSTSQEFVWTADGTAPRSAGLEGLAQDGNRSVAGALGRALSQALGAVAKVVEEVGKRSLFPLLLLIIVALFLAVQDRIDRRDPKLALAPVHADPDLRFLPRLADGGRSGG